AKITLKGNPFRTSGELPAVGAKAPGGRLVNGSLESVGLGDFKGKKKILSFVPSLDTPVCATSTRAFNEKAAGRRDSVVLVISADLPFAQKRFCGAEQLEDVVPLSTVRGTELPRAYGVLIEDGPLQGMCARAIVVLDEHDTVVYTQLVPEIGDEPDYDAALASLAG
ncbi:MAG: thiol peroxidase, partial [Acidobacteriota bacterium]|nr:thiol peroxidase [Acidobacteriota bacterium]